MNMKTEIIVPRFAYSIKSTIGQLIVDQYSWGVTLEDRIRPKGVKVPGKTCIPEGLYPLAKRASPHLKRDVIWIQNVPGFEYVYFHSGNKPEDTDACILVAGNRAGTDLIAGNSLAIELRLFAYVNGRGWDGATLKVINLPGFENVIGLQ
jgi:hypothetical protein